MTIHQFPPIHNMHRPRRGGVLVGMIAVMLIMGVMGLSIVSLSQSSERSYLTANSQSRAYYLAESGLRYAQTIYCKDGWLHGRERTLRLEGGEEVNVLRLFTTFWATSIVGANTPTEARARVPMRLSPCGDNSEIEGEPVEDLAIFGELAIAIEHNTTIQGDVAIVDGDVNINGNVNGSVLARNVAFNGTSTLSGDIYASGLVDVTNGDVTGDVHARGIVKIKSESTVVGGWVFSGESVILEGSAQIQGHIHACGGDVRLSGGTSAGTAAKPIEVRASGDVVLTGSAKIYGDVHAGGSVTINGGTAIYGNVYAGGSISGTLGTLFEGVLFPNSPGYVREAYCPDLTNLEELELPPATEFTAGGADVKLKFPDKLDLPPGVYGALTTNGWAVETQLTLNAGSTGDGVYYFDRMFLGQALTVRLNLSGTHDLHVFVEGNIQGKGALNILVSTDGVNYYPITDPSVDLEVASRVYWETASDFNLKFQSNWFGSVYAPKGSLSVGYGGYLVGSFYSVGGHNLAGVTVVHVNPNYFRDN